MKRFYGIHAAVLLLFLLPISARSQQGRPLYTISVTRSGTSLGDILIELYPDVAPKHVANFDSLVGIGFYDGTAFHRVIPGFVIQGGDPNSKDKPRSTWGYGDPSQTKVPAEFSRLSHLRGWISAARTPDPNSATSQFFICVGNPTQLDGKYSIYGRVLKGMDIVDTIVNSPRDAGDNPLEKIEMTVVRTGTDESVPEVLSLIAPDNGAQFATSTGSLRWEPASDAILYQLQISESPDFATTIVDTLVPSGSYRPTTVVGNPTIYYWRVRATNGGRRGEYSETRTFNTGVLSVGAMTHQQEQMVEAVYDGQSGDVQVRFNSRLAGSVALQLTDVRGRVVAELDAGQLESGQHVLSLDATGIAAGLYFVRLTIGDEIRTERVVIVR